MGKYIIHLILCACFAANVAVVRYSPVNVESKAENDLLAADAARQSTFHLTISA